MPFREAGCCSFRRRLAYLRPRLRMMRPAHQRAQSAGGGKDTMEAGEVYPRAWCQCCQPGAEIKWRKDDVDGAVNIADFQAMAAVIRNLLDAGICRY